MNWFLLISLATVAVARKSPNADKIAQLRNQAGSRFSDNVLEDAELDVPGLIAKYGYPVEVHTVVTSDGYILEAHRIPHGRNNESDTKKPVVFVMHGLLSSSADFLVLGPGNALGYLLADAGYDVWFGNARGNYYSRNHVSMSPDHWRQDFWRFSWDEIGNHDLPAFIDYVLETTGQQKLHYIGHSQGGTSFLVLNSLRPEYNEKFISFQGLAPASYFTYNENEVFNELAPLENIIETTAFTLGFAEIFGGNDFIPRLMNALCGDNSIFGSLCNNVMSININEIFARYNETITPILLGHTPAGASIRQVAHYAQVIRFDQFRRYNFNVMTNLATYGRTTPPEYNLSRVTAPTYIHYGLADNQVDYRDLLLLAARLPNTIATVQVEREDFNHFDFIWGIDAKSMFYDKLLDYMKNAENRFL
ncbi:hypothetical protein K1T71_008210 [Dendrolimus kikuchii]|uniref:Uncharacterized protein n=1 Tax=Dendrolimus kikuchii TaxID=765133 RepID=A0ACC1CWR1_9NEOP|nr:hypothetical protein K1T71_008210 [Dendrolimus kikuchii]